MTLADITATIMPRMAELLPLIQDDKLIRISTDESFDNGILLTFARYSGCDYDENDTYDMRAIIGNGKIIYENAVNGVDARDFVADSAEGIGISLKKYDEIMSLPA